MLSTQQEFAIYIGSKEAILYGFYKEKNNWVLSSTQKISYALLASNNYGAIEKIEPLIKDISYGKLNCIISSEFAFEKNILVLNTTYMQAVLDFELKDRYGIVSSAWVLNYFCLSEEKLDQNLFCFGVPKLLLKKLLSTLFRHHIDIVQVITEGLCMGSLEQFDNLKVRLALACVMHRSKVDLLFFKDRLVSKLCTNDKWIVKLIIVSVLLLLALSLILYKNNCLYKESIKLLNKEIKDLERQKYFIANKQQKIHALDVQVQESKSFYQAQAFWLDRLNALLSIINQLGYTHLESFLPCVKKDKPTLVIEGKIFLGNDLKASWLKLEELKKQINSSIYFKIIKQEKIKLEEDIFLKFKMNLDIF